MNQVQMAAKLYDTRDTMRRFFGDKYQEKVNEYRPYLEAEAKNHGGQVLSAMIALCQKLNADGGGHEIAVAMMMATAVEMVAARNGLMVDPEKEKAAEKVMIAAGFRS